MFNSNSNFIMFVVYYQDPKDVNLFHLQAVFTTFANAFDFYSFGYTGYIKDLSTDEIIFSLNV